jgi:peptidoglycan/LPS O-acetylase OafA/YrhL
MLITVQALTLVVFATLHLSGVLRAEHTHAVSYGAGIAEATICLALLVGAGTLARSQAHGGKAALLSLAFAILGFTIGLTFTISGGNPIDVAYHATMLPVLLTTALMLTRRRRTRGAT